MKFHLYLLFLIPLISACLGPPLENNLPKEHVLEFSVEESTSRIVIPDGVIARLLVTSDSGASLAWNVTGGNVAISAVNSAITINITSTLNQGSEFVLNPPKWNGSGNIRPGSNLITSTEGICSLGVIAVDAHGDYYGITAGHCYPVAGESIVMRERGREPIEIGELVLSSQLPDAGIFRIHTSQRGNVTPLLEYWSGPSKVHTMDAVYIGAEVCFNGGEQAVFDEQQLTRNRCGTLRDIVAKGAFYRVMHWDGLVNQGDSGAALIDRATGAAIALQEGLDAKGNEAVILCDVLAWSRSHGLDLAVVTAPYSDPGAPAALPIVIQVAADVPGDRCMQNPEFVSGIS